MPNVLDRHHVHVTGSGTQPIMFAHGFGCDQNMWRFVAPAFEKDYKVVLFDHAGSGRSDPTAWNPAKYRSLHGYAEDILAIIHALDLHDVVFVGHSVAAMMGVLAANAEPSRFSRLVLVGPSPRYLDDTGYVGGFTRENIEELLESLESNYLGWSQAMAPVIMGNGDRPELGGELAESFCRTNPEFAKQFARTTFMSDNRGDLARCKVPALILQCSNDVIAPLAVGKYLHEHLANSTFVQMAATGHCPNLSAPDETIGAIKTYLAA